jgi:hypothetical protein
MTTPLFSHLAVPKRGTGSANALHREATMQSQLTLTNEGEGPVSTAPCKVLYRTRLERVQKHMAEALDAQSTRFPLAVCCFLSGCESRRLLSSCIPALMLTPQHTPVLPVFGCISFSACSIW